MTTGAAFHGKDTRARQAPEDGGHVQQCFVREQFAKPLRVLALANKIKLAPDHVRELLDELHRLEVPTLGNSVLQRTGEHAHD